MATWTFGTSAFQTTNNSNITSPSFTPAEDDLLVAIVLVAGNLISGTVADSQGGGNWTYIGSAYKDGDSDAVHLFVRPALASSTSTTVTWTRSGNNGGQAIAILRVAGMTKVGADAVRQIATQDNGSGTPAPSFGSNCLTGNPTGVAVGNGTNPAGVTPNASWSELLDNGFNTPTNGLEIAVRNSGFTGNTITGANSAGTFCAIAFELDASNNNISATGATTEGADASSASATEVFSGAGATTEGVDASSSTALETFIGVGSTTEAVDASAAAALETILGAGATTEEVDASAGAGVVANPIDGTSAVTEEADASSAAAAETFLATSAVTEAEDVSAATAGVAEPVDGAGATTEGADASTASAAETFTATSAIDEGADTSSAAAEETMLGAGATTEAEDASSASATETVLGAASTTEAEDASSATAFETVLGAASTTEAPDISDAAALHIDNVAGAGATTEEVDASAGDGTVASPIDATSAVVEAVDASAAVALETVLAASAVVESVDASAGVSDLFVLRGVTRDQFGAPLGLCLVRAYKTSTGELIAETTSDGDGDFVISVLNGVDNYYLVAFNGSASGATDDDLVAET